MFGSARTRQAWPPLPCCEGHVAQPCRCGAERIGDGKWTAAKYALVVTARLDLTSSFRISSPATPPWDLD